jgi:hypothetical protein
MGTVSDNYQLNMLSVRLTLNAIKSRYSAETFDFNKFPIIFVYPSN